MLDNKNLTSRLQALMNIEKNGERILNENDDYNNNPAKDNNNSTMDEVVLGLQTNCKKNSISNVKDLTKSFLPNDSLLSFGKHFLFRYNLNNWLYIKNF